MRINLSEAFARMQKNGDNLIIGDMVKYEGLYADCHTPHIIRTKEYRIKEIFDDRRVIITDDINDFTVYMCELNIW